MFWNNKFNNSQWRTPEIEEKHRKSEKRHLESFRHLVNEQVIIDNLYNCASETCFAFQISWKIQKLWSKSKNGSGRCHFELFSHCCLKKIVLWYCLNSLVFLNPNLKIICIIFDKSEEHYALAAILNFSIAAQSVDLARMRAAGM
jgi:hypothetical protein